MVITLGNEIVDAYTNGVKVIEIYSNGVKVWPARPLVPPGDEIYYTSTDHNVVTPYRDGRGGTGDDYTAGFGARVVNNTYTDIGVIEFDDDINTVHFGFKDCATLETVILPTGVTTIKAAAFDECTGLVYVSIPEGVTTIGWLAFYGCTSLPSITFPSTLTKIESDAIHACPNLLNVIVNATVPPVLEPDSMGRYTFYDCSPNMVIRVPSGSVQAYKTATGWSDYASQIVSQ